MSLYNFIHPDIYRHLYEGHVRADELASIFKNWSPQKPGYYCIFDLEKRQDFKGYQGMQYPALGWIPLDFDDSKNPDNALLDAKRTIELLKLEPHTYKLFSSGSKGYHLYIRHEYFKCLPSETYAKQIGSIIKRIGKELTLSTLDDGIYTAAHKFRIPGSLHERSRRVKECVDGSGDLTEYTVPSFKLDYKPAAFQVYKKALPLNYGMNPLDLIPKKPLNKACIKLFEQERIKEGDRHHVLLALIHEYVDLGRSVDKTEAMVRGFCERNGLDQKRERLYIDIIDKAYAGEDYNFGCYSGIKYKYCNSGCQLYKHLDTNRRAKV